MHLSTDIGKTSTPLPSFPEQSSILSKMGRNESFLATTLLGGVGGGGGQRDEPKANQKIVIRSLMSPT